METIKTNSDRGLMILFDELDSTFHPQWQQRILDSLQTFFNALYPGFYIHIVLTTHSPILLSDLPADHVIFIRKSGAGTIAETSHQQTFAANIATLYYDSFFMEQGSIGSLAAKTIDSLYMALQMLSQETNPNLSIRHKERLLVTRFYENIGRKSNSNYINRDFQLIKSFISSVGEPLWRYKLEQKLYLN